MKIVAIVVTYNRKKLLVECLSSILDQTKRVDKLIIVDNNSTDGTYECLDQNGFFNKEEIIYKKLNKNIGGAGGFYEGMKESLKYSPDWLWIMDDDTIPTHVCLENLVSSLKIIKGKISYLASSVYGENEETMNVPLLNEDKSENGYPDWYQYLEHGIVKIKEATFVSLLINGEAVKQIGLPMKNYFIWGDDTEYTLRLNKYYGNSYFIGNSKAIHKRAINKNLSIYSEENLNRIHFYYYMIRNNLINKSEYYGFKKTLKFFINWQIRSIKILIRKNCKYKLKKVATIHKGLLAFLFQNYDKKAFKNRLDIHVKYKNF